VSFSFATLLEWLGFGQEVLHGIKNFVNDHAVALAIASALIALAVIRLVQGLMVEDVREGRYVPSGSLDAPLEPSPLGLEPSGTLSPLGQAE
jgi:hypothetical protein